MEAAFLPQMRLEAWEVFLLRLFDLLETKETHETTTTKQRNESMRYLLSQRVFFCCLWWQYKFPARLVFPFPWWERTVRELRSVPSFWDSFISLQRCGFQAGDNPKIGYKLPKKCAKTLASHCFQEIQCLHIWCFFLYRSATSSPGESGLTWPRPLQPLGQLEKFGQDIWHVFCFLAEIYRIQTKKAS